jgi:hypothetical protein
MELNSYLAADLIHANSYMASPFIVQPLHIVAKVFLDDVYACRHTLGEDTVHTILAMISQQNLHILVKTLRRMETRWAGVGHALTVRATILKLFEQQLLRERATEMGNANAVSHDAPERTSVVDFPDTGILRRYTGMYDLDCRSLAKGRTIGGLMSQLSACCQLSQFCRTRRMVCCNSNPSTTVSGPPVFGLFQGTQDCALSP